MLNKIKKRVFFGIFSSKSVILDAMKWLFEKNFVPLHPEWA